MYARSCSSSRLHCTRALDGVSIWRRRFLSSSTCSSFFNEIFRFWSAAMMNRSVNRYDPVDGIILWISLSAWILGYCTVCIHRQTYKQKSVVKPLSRLVCGPNPRSSLSTGEDNTKAPTKPIRK
jgi:hypothetical protein